MKTAEEIFNKIPFLSICEEGKWYQLPKYAVIEAMEEYATQCQQDNAERRWTDKEMIDFADYCHEGRYIDKSELENFLTTLNKQ